MLNECILLIRQTPLPFIAAVNGAASGGGCNLALACDLVIAGEGARFNQAFIKIGLVPDCGGTFILPRLVGWKLATEMMMTGDVVTAGRALELGMINAVFPDEQLMAQAMAMAERLAQAPTVALGKSRSCWKRARRMIMANNLNWKEGTQIEAGQDERFQRRRRGFHRKETTEVCWRMNFGRIQSNEPLVKLAALLISRP